MGHSVCGLSTIIYIITQLSDNKKLLKGSLYDYIIFSMLLFTRFLFIYVVNLLYMILNLLILSG